MTATEFPAHALLGPSSAERWMTCPPSARMGEKIADESSAYAEQGSLAHALAEMRLRHLLGELSDDEFTAVSDSLTATYGKDGITLTADDHVAVSDYVNHVWDTYTSLALDTDVSLYVEQRLDLTQWIPESFGTADAVVVTGDGLLHVFDLKFGKGVPVDANRNPQLMQYAAGAIEKFGVLYDIERVCWTIVQPRLGSVSTDGDTASNLLDWMETVVKPRADMAYRGEGELTPSEKGCRWCPVKATCPARAKAAIEAAKSDFATTKVELLTSAQMAHALPLARAMAAWAADVESWCLEQARDHGVVIPGFKLVRGRSNRRWKDGMAEKAIDVLAPATGKPPSEFYTTPAPEPLSVAQVEKLVGKTSFKAVPGMVEKPEGKPTLVSADDPRDSLDKVSEAREDFSK